MANTAILVGNSQYHSLDSLSCCHDDLLAMRELLASANKYSLIEVIENTDADGIKSRIRAAIDQHESPEELFFYFTGHGCQQETEFYYCATDFDSRRPNQTGLSSSELHTLLRLSNADVVVKVIDACNSGTLLIKAGGGFEVQQENEFKSLIQISSCLQSQNSLTGEPLSIFTEKFRSAALRKKVGIVYYTDIIYALRDEFLQNNDQIPFFVFQATAREEFVNDANSLDSLRAKLTAITELSLQPRSEVQQTLPTDDGLRVLLEEAEKNVATPERVASLVSNIFDDLIENVSKKELSNFFTLDIIEHSDFKELTAEAFIASVLLKESRPDEFVTATIKREERRNPFQLLSSAVMLGISGDAKRYRDSYILRLNCEMKRVQMKMTLIPKYHSLKQIVLVVTCAPSLGNCYVFEIGSQHSLKDFGEFDGKGDEVVRRWYRLKWDENTDGIVTKIASKIDEIIRGHLESTQQRLIKE